MAVRWAARYRWARELLQALDLTTMQPDGQYGTTAAEAGSTVAAAVGGTGGTSTSGRGQGLGRSGSLAVRFFSAAVVRYFGLLLRRIKRIWIWFWIWDRPSGKFWEGLDGWAGPGGTATVDEAGVSGSPPKQPPLATPRGGALPTSSASASAADLADLGESVEWVNMCWRKVRKGWRGAGVMEWGGQPDRKLNLISLPPSPSDVARVSEGPGAVDH